LKILPPISFDDLVHFVISRPMIVKTKFGTFTKMARIVHITNNITMI